MKILLIHNYYRERGGEDEAVEAQKVMLKRYGHEVIVYARHNEEIAAFTFIQKSKFFLKDIYWSTRVYRDVRRLIRQRKPDVAHVHNLFYLISPSVYQACRDEGVPIVQTLHNYRFLCPVGTFFRDGRPCEDCVKHGLGSAVRHKCWNNSRIMSFVQTGVVKTIQHKSIVSAYVDHLIALSQFSKNKFVAAGMPEHKISVQPHFVEAHTPPLDHRQGNAIFIGRLADYKGVKLLLNAFAILGDQYPLTMIGDGPLRAYVRQKSKEMKHVSYLGRLPYNAMLTHLKSAYCLIWPSLCHETFGRVVIEAFSCGVPVIISDIGAAAELVRPGQTGLTFKNNDCSDLVRVVETCMSRPDSVKKMGRQAYGDYRQHFTMGKSYERLMAAYHTLV